MKNNHDKNFEAYLIRITDKRNCNGMFLDLCSSDKNIRNQSSGDFQGSSMLMLKPPCKSCYFNRMTLETLRGNLITEMSKFQASSQI